MQKAGLLKKRYGFIYSTCHSALFHFTFILKWAYFLQKMVLVWWMFKVVNNIIFNIFKICQSEFLLTALVMYEMWYHTSFRKLNKNVFWLNWCVIQFVNLIWLLCNLKNNYVWYRLHLFHCAPYKVLFHFLYLFVEHVL